MKIPSAVKPADAPPPVKTTTDPAKLSVLLATLGALWKKIAPEMAKIAEIKATIATTVLEHGEGKGATKTIVVDDIEMKVAPKTTYTISQDEFRQMVEEFPEERQDVAFGVVRWKSELEKRRYNALAEVDKAIVDKYLTTKEGKPSLKIIYPGQTEEEAEE